MNIIQLKVQCSEVKLCLLRSSCFCCLTLCSVLLELCIHLTLGLLYTGHLTNGDQMKVTCSDKRLFAEPVLPVFKVILQIRDSNHAVKVKAAIVSRQS